MGYLEPAEFVAYGLTTETTDDWVVLASTMMDGFCRRPSLLTATYTERLRVGANGQAVRLSYGPLTAAAGASSPIVSVRTRYGRPRHGEALPADVFRAEVAAAFGVAGSWTTMPPADVDVNAVSGELVLPRSFLGLPWNEVEVSYTAGVAQATTALKVACAQIVRNAQATPALNVRGSRMDTVQMQYFSGVLLDEQVRSLLRPFCAQRVG